MDDLRVAIDKVCVTLIAGIDLTQAFDRVNIKLFTEKLRFLGFSDSASGWIESFLSDRSQVVKFDNGEVSSPHGRCEGVPQGSSMGPTCFSLHINDLPSVLMHCNYHL